jgi:hypothetical protein
MRLTLPYFLRQGNTNRTCAIYYLSVDFCFIVYVDLVSQCPSPFPLTVFPLPPLLGGAGRRQKERMAMINTKERLLSFFSAYATPPCLVPSGFQKTPNKDRGIGREREYDRKRKKTLTN